MNRILLVTLPLIATTGAVWGAEAPGDTTKVNILEIIKQGGLMMWPLGALSIGALVLILLLFFTIHRFKNLRNNDLWHIFGDCNLNRVQV